jgi:arabinose-5-phosphate isomerase
MERNRRKAISVLPVISASEENLFVGLLRLHDLIRAGFSISTSPSKENQP